MQINASDETYILNYIELVDSPSANLNRILNFFLKITNIGAFTTSLGKEIYFPIAF